MMGGRGSGGSGRTGAAGGGGSTKTVTTGGITYQLDRLSSAEKMVLVEVSVSKLNDAWKRGATGYIAKGGADGIAGRREGVQAFLKTGNAVNAPRVTLRKDGTVVIGDGRHRTSVLRDSGKRRIAIAVTRSQAARIRKELD